MHPGSLDGTGRGQEMPGSQHLSLLPSRWTWILVWFLTALYASYCAKQLKQRQINKLADAGGGSIFSVWVFFPDYLKKIMSYMGLWTQKEQEPFSWVLDATKMEPHRVVFSKELETGVFRNHIVVDAVIQNPTAFLNLFAPPVFVLQM